MNVGAGVVLDLASVDVEVPTEEMRPAVAMRFRWTVVEEEQRPAVAALVGPPLRTDLQGPDGVHVRPSLAISDKQGE